MNKDEIKVDLSEAFGNILLEGALPEGLTVDGLLDMCKTMVKDGLTVEPQWPNKWSNKTFYCAVRAFENHKDRAVENEKFIYDTMLKPKPECVKILKKNGFTNATVSFEPRVDGQAGHSAIAFQTMLNGKEFKIYFNTADAKVKGSQKAFDTTAVAEQVMADLFALALNKKSRKITFKDAMANENIKNEFSQLSAQWDPELMVSQVALTLKTYPQIAGKYETIARRDAIKGYVSCCCKLLREMNLKGKSATNVDLATPADIVLLKSGWEKYFNVSFDEISASLLDAFKAGIIVPISLKQPDGAARIELMNGDEKNEDDGREQYKAHFIPPAKAGSNSCYVTLLDKEGHGYKNQFRAQSDKGEDSKLSIEAQVIGIKSARAGKSVSIFNDLFGLQDVMQKYWKNRNKPKDIEKMFIDQIMKMRLTTNETFPMELMTYLNKCAETKTPLNIGVCGVCALFEVFMTHHMPMEAMVGIFKRENTNGCNLFPGVPCIKLY